MLILCKIDDIETAVVAYGPGKNAPMAIVPWRDANGKYVLKAFHLGECEILNLPPKLQRKLKKLDDKRHAKAVKNTQRVAETFANKPIFGSF